MAKQPISYTCRGCGKKMKLPAAKIGSGVKCPGCGRLVSDDPADDIPPPRPASATRRRAAPAPEAPPASDREDADVAFPGMASSDLRLPEGRGGDTQALDDDEPRDDAEPIEGELEPEDEDPAPPAHSTASRARGEPGRGEPGRGEPGRAERAAGRGRARVGNTALKRIAGLAPLFGVLLVLACGAIVYYYVTQGGAAVMATTEREAMFNAVFFGCLGMIGFVLLVTAGKLASGLVTLSDHLADLREELRDR